MVSLAVLGDSSQKWRPQHYEHSLWGCRVRFEFPIVKLRDYYQRWADLEASANPFAVVVMAHVQTQRTRRQPPTRLQGKLGLIRHLYTRGFTRQIILDVFRFIDWIMTLPTELETQFQVELAQLEAEIRMPPYITTIERSGIAKGLQQGAARVLGRQLTRRFGPLPAWAEERLAQASTQELDDWAERVLDAPRLEDVFTPSS